MKPRNELTSLSQNAGSTSHERKNAQQSIVVTCINKFMRQKRRQTADPRNMILRTLYVKSTFSLGKRKNLETTSRGTTTTNSTQVETHTHVHRQQAKSIMDVGKDVGRPMQNDTAAAAAAVANKIDGETKNNGTNKTRERRSCCMSHCAHLEVSLRAGARLSISAMLVLLLLMVASRLRAGAAAGFTCCANNLLPTKAAAAAVKGPPLCGCRGDRRGGRHHQAGRRTQELVAMMIMMIAGGARGCCCRHHAASRREICSHGCGDLLCPPFWPLLCTLSPKRCACTRRLLLVPAKARRRNTTACVRACVRV